MFSESGQCLRCRELVRRRPGRVVRPFDDQIRKARGVNSTRFSRIQLVLVGWPYETWSRNVGNLSRREWQNCLDPLAVSMSEQNEEQTQLVLADPVISNGFVGL
jgi:hypothetical protein